MTGVVVVCREHDDGPSDNNDLIRDILEDKGLFRCWAERFKIFRNACERFCIWARSEFLTWNVE